MVEPTSSMATLFKISPKEFNMYNTEELDTNIKNFPPMPPVLAPKEEYGALPRIKMHNVKERIPDLIAKLNGLNTQHSYERQYVGEAISFLRVLQDMIE